MIIIIIIIIIYNNNDNNNNNKNKNKNSNNIGLGLNKVGQAVRVVKGLKAARRVRVPGFQAVLATLLATSRHILVADLLGAVQCRWEISQPTIGPW